MTPAPEPPPLRRLDPDRVAAPVPDTAGRARPAADPAAETAQAAQAAQVAEVATRRYRWMIGIVGLVLVVGVSIYQIASHGLGTTTGVPAGERLHVFSAPLATSDLDGVPNPAPPCTIQGHDPRILNLCLMVRHGPVALAFFVPGARSCVRQIDALQALSRRFAQVQFAAVAIASGHSAVARTVRAHHWTIPVAYDSDGRVGALYGVAACPMVELARRGGIVVDRLIGNHWERVAPLAARLRALG